MHPIELLAPAKDCTIAKAAIDCGADAVYIGAPKFGARINAANSINDLKELIVWAHKYHVKIYITLNTILYDEELVEANELIKIIYDIGADALIIQDMGILEMDLPPIPLHASTQAHTIQWQKAEFLEKTGFSRIVLGRELSITQIKEIHSKTSIELETFIHGALCVSYSGQCYLSCFAGGRSGNRGQCAQPCRLPYNLSDKNGNIILKDKHVLSLRDLNLSGQIKELIDAGVSSLKIEGRLKDINYVKNIVGFYRKEIDKIIASNSNLQKPSLGNVNFNFEPDTEKTFNRNYSNYFIQGRQKDISAMDSPKSKGKFIGKIKYVGNGFFTLDTQIKISNGDGLCYLDFENKLQGFRVNTVEGNQISPFEKIKLATGISIYRNLDVEFNKALERAMELRKIPADISIENKNDLLIVTAKICSQNISATSSKVFEKTLAQKPELAMQNIKNQLNKTGNSIFEISKVEINLTEIYFFPVSLLNELRREVLIDLENKISKYYLYAEKKITKNDFPFPLKDVDYHTNITNRLALAFYRRHGIEKFEFAPEITNNFMGNALMITKLCIKYQLGFCPKYQNKSNQGEFKEPFYLENEFNKFKLNFNCDNCEMIVAIDS